MHSLSRKTIYSCFLFLVSSFSFPVSVFAQTTKAWSGKCLGTGNASDVATIQGLECAFYNILQVIVAFAGLAFFIMLISGGFKYLFSSGDDKKAAAAASSLTMAIFGLIGVIAAWFILKLIEKFTGVKVTEFIIPG